MASVDTPRGKVELFDDFLHDAIATSSADGVVWLNSSDSGDTAFAIAARSGGQARGSTTTTDDNLIELSAANLQWRGQEGYMEMEVRAQLDVITNFAFNIGFNDDALEDSNTLPIELATATFTANSATFFGILYDIDATNADLHATWVDDSSLTTTPLATLRFTGVAPTAAQWATYRVELQDQESGNQMRGKVAFTNHLARRVEKVFASTIDRDSMQVPYTGWENRSATAHVVDLDYVYACMSRPL